MNNDTTNRPALAEWLAVALSLLALDLLWLGWLGRPIYNAAIGHLLRPEANKVAALAFYLFYVSLIWYLAVRGNDHRQAARKGAALGFVSYGVYDLTNWAVLIGWPGWLVPIDWGWGIFLTAWAAWWGVEGGRRGR